MWEVVENEVGKTRVVKAEKTKKGENNGSEKSNIRMGGLE